ncbi:MAG TPA: hypothetical protein ENH60_12490, partial [Pricia sp.]|nr:hypothetical protein [Pricia sp.]
MKIQFMPHINPGSTIGRPLKNLTRQFSRFRLNETRAVVSCWMKQEVRVFEIPVDKSEELKKFHAHECTLKGFGAIGGRFTYKFTPTSLGDII